MQQDFLFLAGKTLPKMRLIAEGAIQRFESDSPCAKNDVAAALYLLCRDIEELQMQYAEDSEQPNP